VSDTITQKNKKHDRLLVAVEIKQGVDNWFSEQNIFL
jgi:hypothetical protein